ncbi:glycerol-3-phosphate dehydrogenase [Conexibacter sp. CPCC 206217]|uniref:glycerol-3-phosphate dehydrogenase n=1 Tax=Conexibacter sp. CPCC 206217 TaxID=3064574 RepID=UPI00271F05C2|nr:glycerol-3-phosphate dehydrogenase [Conexibacter sp. CPCC 206217]MDO8213512.1 glycerol-3-phosphate dehydrogenase [Conexibacter sp. CPCC 206217]
MPDTAFERPFDVIVVGAGINGAGIARDASLRGLSVLLLDKGDLGAGTTSRSTRLVHGGLRYLEHRELPLVRESLREREVLLHIAPHLVHPLSFLLPVYEEHKRGTKMIRMGMMAYDALSMDKSMSRHRMLNGAEALQREPGLRREGLRGAAAYYDAQAEYPERLALENALDARRLGAVVLPYMRVAELQRGPAGRVTGVALHDDLHERSYVAHGSLVVNAAGPWVDRVLGGIEAPDQRMIGGTKGSHLVVGPFPGAPHEAVYTEAVEDGRPYFIVPWNGQYLIGTTDVRFDGDLDTVAATDAEIDYLISETNKLIPGAGLTSENVLYTYAGVRPLPVAPDGDEGAITRSHVVHDHAPGVEGLLSIVGGKITTYRQLAEEVVDAAVKKLDRKAGKCRTHQIPLPGGTAYPFERFRERFHATSDLDRETGERLLRIYGTRAAELLDYTDGHPDLREPFDELTGAIGAEVAFSLRTELAETLTDVLQRRTMVGFGPQVGLNAVDAAAEIAVRHLGWSDARAAREADGFRGQVDVLRPRLRQAQA